MLSSVLFDLCTKPFFTQRTERFLWGCVAGQPVSLDSGISRICRHKWDASPCSSCLSLDLRRKVFPGYFTAANTPARVTKLFAEQFALATGEVETLAQDQSTPSPPARPGLISAFVPPPCARLERGWRRSRRRELRGGSCGAGAGTGKGAGIAPLACREAGRQRCQPHGCHRPLRALWLPGLFLYQ